ncbi:MAG TPA: hypothetical protein VNA44_03005 [Burkholderiaceae bacterium]|nr:hypothetical protein [Burkholderiaceae bacterium]
METTAPKTGYSGAVSGTSTVGSSGTGGTSTMGGSTSGTSTMGGAAGGTSTMGGGGRFEANRTADSAHGSVDQVAQGAHDTVDRIAAKAGPAMDRMRSAASDVQTTASAKYDDFINAEWVETARDEVRARPLAAVGIALAAGLLISRLL